MVSAPSWRDAHASASPTKQATANEPNLIELRQWWADGKRLPAAAGLLNLAGLKLDPWQWDEILAPSLETREDGKWAYFQVGAVVPRQNGKGSVLEGRELIALYLDTDCRVIIHSAHEQSTSASHMLRLADLIDASPQLASQVRIVRRGSGTESIELIDGCRIRFKTRTKAGGRGLSGDLLVLDEAMILSDAAHGALLPTLSARPNPQVWYTGSAADEMIHEYGVVLARLREAGQRGDDGLLYVEHSAEPDLREQLSLDHDASVLEAVLADPALLADEALWRAANPAMAVGRIVAEFIAFELRSMDPRTFAVERLGVSEWPSTAADSAAIISADDWRALADPESQIVGRVAFAADVAPNRSRASIAVAGRRADGKLHVEIVEHAAGTGWLLPRIVELLKEHGGTVAIDGRGPAAALAVELLKEHSIVAVEADSQDMAQACGSLFDAATQDELRHLGTAELAGAVAGAATRPLGDAWAWARKKSSIDITPLVAVTLASWALGAAVPASSGFFAFA